VPTPRKIAIQAEWADTQNWLDGFAAAPPHVTAALGLAVQRNGELVMVRSRIPFSHFNMVLTLGCPAPADAAAFEAIERFYGATRHWVLVNDHSEPADLAQQLAARGYAGSGSWDRVLLHEPRVDLWTPRAAGELVDAANANEWSSFLCRCYGMPPVIADWLQAYVGRPGWIHAILREGGRADGPVTMARSLFMAEGGWAWLGIDAPVPGVMAPCFDADQAVSATLLLAAARAGARHFVTDIEAPSPERRGPGYRGWSALGFEPAYLRTLYAKG
jgi:hypothetical protein